MLERDRIIEALLDISDSGSDARSAFVAKLLHAALALGIMHLSWGTGFLGSAGKAALGRLPGLRRPRV